MTVDNNINFTTLIVNQVMPEWAVEITLEAKEQVSQVATQSKQTEEKALERNGHALTQPKSVVD